jgi:hypothetical protein
MAQENLPQKEMTASVPSLREHQPHRQWIAGRIATLLSHYWRDDDPMELLTAMATDWVEVLAGMPQSALQQACIQYLRDEPRRRPTPGAILDLARRILPPPSLVRKVSMPPVEVDRIVATKDQREAIMNEIGFRPKQFGGDTE